MNADLHMADDLKNTGKGNLFVIFGARRLSRPPFAAIIVRSTEGLDADDASRTQ
jgi:adenine-specific DNA-methyltransferase